MLGHGQSVNHMRAYWKGDIHTMVYNNFGPVAPDIVEQVVHNLYGLIPHQCIIFLNNRVQPLWAKNWSRSVPLRMPEQRSFGISSNPLLQKPRCLFQKRTTPRKDLWAWGTWHAKLLPPSCQVLEEVRSPTQSEVETHFDGSSICKAYTAARPGKRTNLQVCFLLSLRPFHNHVTEGITREIASCPATANSVVRECALNSVRSYRCHECHQSVPSYFLPRVHFVPIFR
jgi:hypothetical protein